MFQRFVTGVLCALMMVGSVVAPTHAQGDPVQGAKGAIAALGRAKGLSDIANSLTNEGAATIGLMFALPIKAMLGMADSMAASGKGVKADPKATAEMEKMKSAIKGMEKILAKYGASKMDATSMMSGKNKMEIPSRVKGQGRAMFAELGTILEKTNPKMVSSINGKSVPKPETLTYKVLSPTRVAISNPAKPTEKFESRYEDGKWRVHISQEMVGGGGSAP